MKEKFLQRADKSYLNASISSSQDDRTVELVWTTGSKGMRSDFGERYYEELSLDSKSVDLSRLVGNPLLAVHNQSSLDAVVGVVERVWIEGNVGKALVRFAKDDDSEKIFQKVKDRVLRNVSVGYSVQQYTDISDDDDDVPTYLATLWTPLEISIVPIGFDKDAKFRHSESKSIQQIPILNRAEKVQENILKTKNENEAAVQAERNRANDIRLEVRNAKLSEELADELINNGSDLETAKRNIAQIAKYSQAAATTAISTATRTIEVGASSDEMKRDALVDAFAARIEPSFKPRAEARIFQGQSAIRAVEHYLGRKLGESDASFAKRAMMTSDLPAILAASAEKAALSRYKITPRSFERWTKKDSTRNYKQASRVRAGDVGLVERAENANYDVATFGEEVELVQLKDYGRIHAFSSQMIVNDDLKMLQSVASEGGVAAGRLENKRVYLQLTSNPVMNDSKTLFHADHNNLGTAGALSETTINEAVRKMRKQTSVDGLDTLNLAPKFLIVGPDLESEAKKLLAQIQPTSSSDVNPFAGSMELIVDAEVSGNKYFFAADPMMIDTVTLFHLEGQEAPRIESRVKWENDSLEIKLAHAVEAKALDWRGLFYNPGPA